MNSWLDRYKKFDAPVKASLWFAVCSALQKGIMLLFTPLFTRLLTTEQYGQFTIYQSWYTIITVLATLNLFYGAFNNGVLKYKNNRKQYTASLQSLTTVITLALFLFYILFSDLFNRLLEMPSMFIVLMFAEILFTSAFNFWSADMRFDYQYKSLVVITVIIAVASPIIATAGILLTKYKIESLIFSFAGIKILCGLAVYVYNLARGRMFFNKEYWLFALRLNIPLVPHYLAMTILNQADRIMISQMIGQGEAAIYAVAYSIAMMMTILTNAINNSFIPYTYKTIESGDYGVLRKTASSLLILVAFICTLTMALGPEIVRLFAAKAYYDAIWVIPPVAASVYFMFLYPLFGNIEFYFEKTRFIMYASCLAAALNILLNYIFIPVFGYYAASYTTLVCYIISALAHYLFYRHVLKTMIPGTTNLYDVRAVVLLSLVVLAAMIVTLFLYRLTILRYLLIMGLVISAVIFRSRIRSMIQRLVGKEE